MHNSLRTHGVKQLLQVASCRTTTGAGGPLGRELYGTRGENIELFIHPNVDSSSYLTVKITLPFAISHL